MNGFDKEDEEQEVILDIRHSDHDIDQHYQSPVSGAVRDGAALPNRFGMDQHQRYLEAVFGEHKVKVERGTNRREALVVDVDSDDDDDDDDNDVHGTENKGKAKGNMNNGYDNDDEDDDEEEEEEEDEDGNSNKYKYGDGDLDDIVTVYGMSRRDSGIEEKSQHSGNVEGRENMSLFDPINFAGNGGNSVTGNTSRPRKEGLHPRLSVSSSYDTTSKPPDKLGRPVPKPAEALPNGNGISLDLEPTKSPIDSNDKNFIKSLIENSGGVRVFPLDAGTSQVSFLNGNYRPKEQASLTDQTGRNIPRGPVSDNGMDSPGARVPPDPLPRGSPALRRVRAIKVPPADSDFKNGGFHATDTEFESFVELTDL
ncbi:hypothetical protein EGW08_010185 [Elysia chlorotica]|uniref:Uncharacterized protein n=1 Tax=Elysia chlorotica TaxID=188477 RepID=A0A433TKL4_ELYCH|nr:hypothetical protein EGW08_010185 [Elysia chlorotica]